MKFTIKEKVFKSEIYVYVKEPYEKIIKEVKSEWGWDLNPLEGLSDGRSVMDERYRYGWLWIKEHPKVPTSSFISLICHEAGHWAFHILENVGDYPKYHHGEEVFLYLQQFIIESILDKLYKKQTKHQEIK